MSKPAKDLRSRTQPEHVALLDRAADDAGRYIEARSAVAGVLVQLGWLSEASDLPLPQAEFMYYRITPHGLRVHAKAHGRSLAAPAPALEALSDSESDEPEPYGCGPRGRTYAAQADTWGLDQ